MITISNLLISFLSVCLIFFWDYFPPAIHEGIIEPWSKSATLYDEDVSNYSYFVHYFVHYFINFRYFFLILLFPLILQLKFQIKNK